MKQWLCQLGVVGLFLIAVQPVGASSPTIAGEISGEELCPEKVCGAAIFTGTFQGAVGDKPTPGFFWVACDMKRSRLPAIRRLFLAANGVYQLFGAGLMVRCLGETFLTTEIIHLISAWPLNKKRRDR